jgi:hypothetical protein
VANVTAPSPGRRIVDHSFTIHVDFDDPADSFLEELVIASGVEKLRRRTPIDVGPSCFLILAAKALAHHDRAEAGGFIHGS